MKCEIKITGIKSLQNKLKKLNRITQPTYIRKILEKLVSIGINACDYVYQQADFDNAEKKYNFTTEWVSDSCLCLCANGEQITFLEFGTGVWNNADRDYPRADLLGMTIGDYGKGHGKNEFWYYPRENNPNGTPKKYHTKNGDVESKKWNWTRGTPAAKGMYQASKEMQEKISEVVLEAIK